MRWLRLMHSSCVLQVMDAQDAVSDRFYGALYQAMLHFDLASSSALPQFLSIVFQVCDKRLPDALCTSAC